MKLETFRIERYFAEHEFTARRLLSASDCESVTLTELLGLADDETRALWERLWLGYTESAGHPLLREEIAGLYGLSAEDMLVAAPEEAIFVAMNALLEPGDEVVVTWPAYQSLAEIARAIGCRVLRWELRVKNGRWALDPDELAALLSPRTKLVVANFPHNPTGYLPARAEWEEVVRMTAERGVTLFSDEMYRWLEYHEGQTLSAACEMAEKAVTLGGVSKSLGLPGLRIGWLATRDRSLLRRASEIKDYTTICSSAPSEILALMGLRARDWLVGRNVAIVLANLREAEKHFGHRRTKYEWLPPMAGPVAFPRWLGEGPTQAWADATVRERGVMIAPGEMFEMPGHFRVGLGRRAFRAALEAL
jgi:aspartate/methionine/tyrosine aminotransferase